MISYPSLEISIVDIENVLKELQEKEQKLKEEIEKLSQTVAEDTEQLKSAFQTLQQEYHVLLKSKLGWVQTFTQNLKTLNVRGLLKSFLGLQPLPFKKPIVKTTHDIIALKNNLNYQKSLIEDSHGLLITQIAHIEESCANTAKAYLCLKQHKKDLIDIGEQVKGLKETLEQEKNKFRRG